MKIKQWHISILFILFLTVLYSNQSFSQNLSKLYKEGKEYFENQKYEAAIRKFTNIIKINDSYRDVYEYRAMAFEKMNQKKEAADDYISAAQLTKKNTELYFNAGRLYFEVKDYYQAIKYLNKCTESDKKHLEAYIFKIKALMLTGNYSMALSESVQALKIKKTAINYYNLANASYHLKDYKGAEENLLQATKLDLHFEDAFFLLAELYENQSRTEEALNMVNRTIILNPRNKEAFLLRSKIFETKGDLANAINDLSQIIVNINKEDIDVYFQRAALYRKIAQYNEAVLDYSIILNILPFHPGAILERAQVYEELNEKEKAVNDYIAFINLQFEVMTEYSNWIDFAKARIYELNKEDNIPVLDLRWPFLSKNKEIEIPSNRDTINVKGSILDESELKFFRINGEEIRLSQEFGTRLFDYSLNINDTDRIIIEAEDIYHNRFFAAYPIIKTETNPPSIHLLNPFANSSGIIKILNNGNNGANLFIEGKVTDESFIDEILIDDVRASFKNEEINPVFTAMVDIRNKSELIIKVRDQYGNENSGKFALVREQGEGVNNMMGKTWIVFIENSDYLYLQPLKGPSDDAALMLAALQHYQTDSIIHLKNMNKNDMQKFFSLDLRDLVKAKQVNSILIWYAGHGKFQNETGYWLPVNASADDEFSYFTVNSLKAYLQVYSKYLNHILIVTDACEAGPSFFLATRSEKETKDCSDWSAAAFKSAQVLTSTGNTYANDNSTFAKIFSNSLSKNPDNCISIENIVHFINNAMNDQGKQRPLFGKIAGLEDEDGSFIFLKK